MQNVFDAYPGFEPDPTAALEVEFARLARFKRWKPGKGEWLKARKRLYASEFANHYGSDSGRLQNWQSLCREVRVKQPTESITQCRKALRSAHVNLVDLINCRRSGTKLRKFASCKELREYTANTPGKVFPKDAAKADGFLKALLREIF
ncbi:MAG: hypothetical protein M1832_003788 [Thelocarpon impressellum]|nr:MAG: hypothetical protein M1832_003788 [Thelocarpon impressellum]